MSTPLFDRMKTAAASLARDGREEFTVMIDAMASLEKMVAQLVEGMRIVRALRDANRILSDQVSKDIVVMAEAAEAMKASLDPTEQEDESETVQ